MRSVKSLIAAGAASLLSTVAFAADMPIAAPPPMAYAPPPVQDFGGWYLRGDVGMANSTGKLHTNLYDTLPAGTAFNQYGTGFDGGMIYGVGVGYQFNSWFRADITGEYRSKVSFNGTDFFTFPGTPPSSLGDTYHGGYSSWVGLVNVYADLGTWWCLTPFIGAGVGAASIHTSAFSDNATFPGGVGSSSYIADGATKTNLAWAVHAGVAYRVNQNFTVELAYRYLDMGTAGQGQGHFFDGTPTGVSTFQFRDITSQDVKLGVRFNLPCCDVPPPPPAMPLIRKG